MSVLALMLRAILYPRSQLFVVSGGKNQSANILSDKVSELCKLIPPLGREIMWDTRGTTAKTINTKDLVIYTFRNGSSIQNIAMNDHTRGRRFTSGLMEEYVGLDPDILQEVIIPTTNVKRTVNSIVDPNDLMNQQQVYISTAGYRNTFAYDKMMEILCMSVARPREAIVLGGSWRVPVQEGLLDRNFVTDLKLAGTFNEAAFDREYGSKWGGTFEGAFFDPVIFDKYRTIKIHEDKRSERVTDYAFYVMGIDVGRIKCSTEVCVIKCVKNPNSRDVPIKKVVNLYSFDEEHYRLQAIHIKRIYEEFKCEMVVVDANGIGIGLVDELVLPTEDPDTGATYPGWGVYNDDPVEPRYKQFETDTTIKNVMYAMKANNSINTDLYSYCHNELQAGRLRFLIDENERKSKMDTQTTKQKLGTAARNRALEPYVRTSALREQMCNLVQENEGANIILKQVSRTIPKDKFSALIYALSWCRNKEVSKPKKRFDVSRMMLFSKGK